MKTRNVLKGFGMVKLKMKNKINKIRKETLIEVLGKIKEIDGNNIFTGNERRLSYILNLLIEFLISEIDKLKE